jgi:hypothetical protein
MEVRGLKNLPKSCDVVYGLPPKYEQTSVLSDHHTKIIPYKSNQIERIITPAFLNV